MFHTSMERPAKRPLRVSILAILEGLQGLFLLLGLLTVIVAVRNSGTITIEGYTIFRTDMGIGSELLAGLFLMMGLLSLLFARGLWRLARWAYWATVILQVMSLANSIIAFVQAPAHVAFIIVGTINPALMLFYFLVNANVRAAFRT